MRILNFCDTELSKGSC